MLDENAPRVHAVLQDVLLDLIGHLLPLRSQVVVVVQRGQAGSPVARLPAHHLGRGEMLRLPANLPDPTVRLVPVRHRVLHLALQQRPHLLGKGVAGPRVQIDGIEERAPYVVLFLEVRAVADTDGSGAVVT